MRCRLVGEIINLTLNTVPELAEPFGPADAPTLSAVDTARPVAPRSLLRLSASLSQRFRRRLGLRAKSLSQAFRWRKDVRLRAARRAVILKHFGCVLPSMPHFLSGFAQIFVPVK